MPKLPKKAVIDLQNKTFHIDGQEFPWYVSEQGIAVDGLLDPNTLCTLTFTMPADTVEIIPREPTTDSTSK